MSSAACFRVFSTIAFTSLMVVTSASRAESQSPDAPNSAADSKAKAELSRLFGGLLSDTSAHMRMGPTRMATSADSARAAAIVASARAALKQYVDVNAAERDGYYRNMPWLEDQPIYHYNSVRNIRAEERGEFDITKPMSLLYKKNEQGQLRLVGAMYGAGGSTAPEELDALLPISMAHWHEHVNLCYPGRIAANFSQRKPDAGMVFLVELFFNITSARECESSGGRFVPVEGGWMAHVYLFAESDDPKMIWDADDMGNMDMHMPHPPTGAPRSTPF